MPGSIAGRSAKKALKYPRVLLKLSGEALAGDHRTGFDFDSITKYAKEIKKIVDTGAQIGLVIGGGNIVRGSQLSKMGLDRVSADYMGMLGTVINALAFQDILEREGLDTRVMTAIRMEELAEPYIRRRAMRHLEKGRAVVITTGTRTGRSARTASTPSTAIPSTWPLTARSLKNNSILAFGSWLISSRNRILWKWMYRRIQSQ